jgi:cellobiose-specific phosphotransferase system component IIC
MNRDFDRVNAALAASTAGRALIFVEDVVRSAWRSSSTGTAARSIGGSRRSMPASRLIRAMAVAVGVAAALQPVLMIAMPETVAPAIPRSAFALIALVAALAAWQAEAIAKAWPNSGLARLLGR